jgi:hypothetical protein
MTNDSEIIDLTTSEESIIRDTYEPISPFRIQPRRDGESKRSRRKRRRGQSSATQTREHSLEEGELDMHSIQRGRISGEKGNATQKDSRVETKEQERLSPSPRQLLSSPESSMDPVDVFFVDVQPTSLPDPHVLISPSISDGPGDNLLLPAHVSVSGSAPVKILAVSNVNIDDEDYIEYLDYDERKVGD